MTRGILTGAVLVAAALGLAACASSSGQKLAKNGGHKSGSHLVCFTQTSLGSHIGHQTCMTAAQYKAKQKADANSKRSLREMEQQSNIQSCSDSGTCAGGGPPRH